MTSTRIVVFHYTGEKPEFEKCSLVNWIKAPETESGSFSRHPMYFLEEEGVDEQNPLHRFGESLKTLVENAISSTDSRMTSIRSTANHTNSQKIYTYYLLVRKDVFGKINTPSGLNQRTPIISVKLYQKNYLGVYLDQLKNLLVRYSMLPNT